MPLWGNRGFITFLNGSLKWLLKQQISTEMHPVQFIFLYSQGISTVFWSSSFYVWPSHGLITKVWIYWTTDIVNIHRVFLPNTHIQIILSTCVKSEATLDHLRHESVFVISQMFFIKTHINAIMQPNQWKALIAIQHFIILPSFFYRLLCSLSLADDSAFCLTVHSHKPITKGEGHCRYHRLCTYSQK